MSSQGSGAAGPDQHEQRQPVAVPKHQPNMQADAREREERAANRWEKRSAIVAIWTNALLVAIGIVGTILILRQLGAMKESNRLTRESNELTRASNADAKAGGEQSVRMNERILAAMQESNALTLRGLEETGEHSAASLELARQTLEESRRSLVESQRARLGLLGIDGIDLGDGSAPFTIAARVMNGGNATATDVQLRWGFRYTNGLDRPDPVSDLDSPGSVAVLLGHASHGLVFKVPPLGPARVERVRGKAAFLYVLGEVTYSDGFGNRRRLEFCNVFNSETGGWDVCSFGNYTD